MIRPWWKLPYDVRDWSREELLHWATERADPSEGERFTDERFEYWLRFIPARCRAELGRRRREAAARQRNEHQLRLTRMQINHSFDTFYCAASDLLRFNRQAVHSVLGAIADSSTVDLRHPPFRDPSSKWVSHGRILHQMANPPRR